MRKFIFSAMLLLSVATMPMNVFASETSYGVMSSTATGDYIGTLETVMGSKTSTVENFTLNYANGVLVVEPFQIGSMPGTISVVASGLSLGQTVKCDDSVTLTLTESGVATNYNAKITILDNNGKLEVQINVLNPIYEGLPFVATVTFTEN